ncbi:MAG TPA: phosphoadenosine phosphosulfate reductase family protein [Roseiflexaceae bacterium]|nr:phosphoadenosine phosphosulfate reductase family protein [Roseiflexaceae bacterium]
MSIMIHDSIRAAYDLLDQAYTAHTPVAIVGLFSGGNDSLVTMHVLSRWAATRSVAFSVAHINTGIGIEATRVFVRETCAAFGWTLREYKTDPARYVELVTGRHGYRNIPGGFPGAPLHSMYYRELKDRQVAALMRDMKRGHARNARVVLVSGIRQQESRRRMGRQYAIYKEKARIWVAPLFGWNTEQLLDYRDAERLPRNQVSDCLHMSGECLCGAMNSPGELAEIRFWFPETAAQLDAIAEQVQAAGYPWGWDEKRPDWYDKVKQGQQMFDGFEPLCSSCQWRQEEAA